jgi:flagellar motor switch protein FliN/FliY
MTAEQLGPLAAMPIELEGQLDRLFMTMRQILELEPGALLTLERPAGDNVDIVAGGTLLGFGELLVVENRMCIRVTDLQEER